jgi:chromosome segregation ATPase
VFSVTVFLFVLCARAPWARTTYFEKVSEHPVQTEPLKEIISLNTHLRSEKRISFQFQAEGKNLTEKLQKAQSDLHKQKEQYKTDLREYKEKQEAAADKCGMSISDLMQSRDELQEKYEKATSNIRETGKLIAKHNHLLNDKDEHIQRLQEQLNECEADKQWYKTKRAEEWHEGAEVMDQLEEDKVELEEQVTELEKKVRVLQSQKHSNAWHSSAGSSGDGSWSVQDWRDQEGWNTHWTKEAKR